MNVVRVELPELLEQVIDRQIAQGRFASKAQFLLEAASRLADTLELEDLSHAAALGEVAEIEVGVRAAAEARVGFR